MSPVALSCWSAYLTADPEEWGLRALRDFEDAEGKITEALTLAEKINGELNCSIWG